MLSARLKLTKKPLAALRVFDDPLYPEIEVPNTSVAGYCAMSWVTLVQFEVKAQPGASVEDLGWFSWDVSAVPVGTNHGETPRRLLPPA